MAEAGAEAGAGPKRLREAPEEASEEASPGLQADQESESALLLRGAMDLDDFRCPICLELAYKPVVNACGHVFCFWCVHKAMSPFADSHCPMCRRAFTHFPRTCALLHHLLARAFPHDFAAREADVKAEEARSQVSSPEVLSLEEDARQGQGGKGAGSQPMLGAPPSSVEWLRSACTCLSCAEVLYQPVVLNCGHALCRPCVNQGPQHGHSSLVISGAATEHSVESSPATHIAATARGGDTDLASVDAATAAASAVESSPQESGTAPATAAKDGAAGSPWACPGCGMRQPTQAFAVCSQLHETLERLFPEALARRGREARRAAGKGLAADQAGEEGAGEENLTDRAGERETRGERRYNAEHPAASAGSFHTAQAQRGTRASADASTAACEQETGGLHGDACACELRGAAVIPSAGVPPSHQAPPGITGRVHPGPASCQAPAQHSGDVPGPDGSAMQLDGPSDSTALPRNANGSSGRGPASPGAPEDGPGVSSRGERTSRARGSARAPPGGAATHSVPTSTAGASFGTPEGGGPRSGEGGTTQGASGPRGADAGCAWGASAASGAAAEIGAVQRAWARIQAAQQRVAQARSEEEASEMQRQLRREREEHHIHVGVGCDCCGAYPIVGKRYRCVECSKHYERIGFDLCSACHSADVSVGRFNQRHTPQHRLEEVAARGDAFQRFFEANHPDTVSLLLSMLQDDADYPGYSDLVTPHSDLVTVGQDGMPVAASPHDGMLPTTSSPPHEHDGGNSNGSTESGDVEESGEVSVIAHGGGVEGEGLGVWQRAHRTAPRSGDASDM